MPDPKNPPVNKTASNDQQIKSSPIDDQQVAPVDTVPAARKEQEPTVAEEDVIKEIQEREKEASLHAEREIRKEIGKEAVLREPEAKVPKEVAEAGVEVPEKEATKVLKKGPTIELPMTEQQYEEAQHTKLSAKVTQKREVYGIKSVIALALYIGRLIKKAHKHTRNAIFKKSSSKASEDKGK